MPEVNASLFHGTDDDCIISTGGEFNLEMWNDVTLILNTAKVRVSNSRSSERVDVTLKISTKLDISVTGFVPTGEI